MTELIRLCILAIVLRPWIWKTAVVLCFVLFCGSLCGRRLASVPVSSDWDRTVWRVGDSSAIPGRRMKGGRAHESHRSLWDGSLTNVVAAATSREVGQSGLSRFSCWFLRR